MIIFHNLFGALLVVLIFLAPTESSIQSSEELAGPSIEQEFERRNMSHEEDKNGKETIREQTSDLDESNMDNQKTLSHPEGRRPVSKIRKKVVHDEKKKRGSKSKGTKGFATEVGLQTYNDENEDDPHDREDSSHENYELEDEKHRQSLIEKITKLIQRHHDLAATRKSLRDSSMKESKSYDEVMRRRNALSQDWENVHRAKLRVENDLDFFNTHIELQDETLMQLASQTKDNAFLMDKLKKKYAHLLKDKTQLAEYFREHGLEHWVENSVKGTVNPIVLDAIMQGTGYVVEPMLDGIEKLASMNDEVVTAVSKRLKTQTSLANYPFYSGFVSYAVLLCPLVIMVSILTRVKKGISRLSRTHWIILGTFYFVMVTGGFLAATMFGSVDVLQTFKLHNVHVFNSVLVLHGLAFLVYVLLHFYNMIQVPRQEAVSHFLVVALIAVHFFIRSQEQSLTAEGLQVDVWTYFVYSAVLSFVLYETFFKKGTSSRHCQKGSTEESFAKTNWVSVSSSNLRISAVHASGD
ncbi:unnamed protein product [Agarophyton chilense]|eukprot:gb/GEZJ01001864.1/.p1 GENE.gb/GEZJ01001864.1/~~gb/GEZJ01001864.1/.p1  ORF type:complete len:523 (+),score=86.27 gb/GEZJ01001864.1/:8702-10270(+)